MELSVTKEGIEFKKELNDLEQEIVKREIDISSKEDYINGIIQRVIKQEKQARKNFLISDQRYQEALETYISAISLLTLAVDHLESLHKIRTKVSEVIYQKLEKIDIIYKRIIILTKLVDGDKLLLQQRAIELDNREIYLRDREAMLSRTVKEVQKNGK